MTADQATHAIYNALVRCPGIYPVIDQVYAALVGDDSPRLPVVVEHDMKTVAVLGRFDLGRFPKPLSKHTPLIVALPNHDERSHEPDELGPAPTLADQCDTCWLVRKEFGKGSYTLTTKQVAGFFRRHAAGLTEEAMGLDPNWAPASTDSFAKVTIAGHLGEAIAATPDNNNRNGQYEWYDLTEVLVGGSVYRITHDQILWLFTRTGDDQWRLQVGAAKWPTTSDRQLDRSGLDLMAILEGIRMASSL